MHDEKLRNTWNKMIQQTLGGASDDEMKKRSEHWKNPNSSPKSGVLAKYKKTVQSASKGAITD